MRYFILVFLLVSLSAFNPSISKQVIGLERTTFDIGSKTLASPIQNPSNFISTWSVSSGSFELPLKDYTNITIDWGDGSTPTTHTSGAMQSHTYASTGTYTISVTVNDTDKDIGKIYVKNHISRTLLRTIEQWGEGKWESFYQSYYDAANLTIPATDQPDLSLVSQMNYAFRNCTSLVGLTFNDWDVSNVTSLMLSLIHI